MNSTSQDKALTLVPDAIKAKEWEKYIQLRPINASDKNDLK